MNLIAFKKREMSLCVLCIVTFFLPALFFGCARNVRYYFYDGTPLPSAEVATAVLHGDLMLLKFDNTAMAKFSKTYDMPPGNHRLEFFYSHSSTTFGTTTHYSGRYFIDLHTKPGHVYYIYPKILRQNQWLPEMVEFTGPEDFLKFNPEFFSGLVAGKEIKKKVDQHFIASQTHSLRICPDAIDGNVWK